MTHRKKSPRQKKRTRKAEYFSWRRKVFERYSEFSWPALLSDRFTPQLLTSLGPQKKKKFLSLFSSPFLTMQDMFQDLQWMSETAYSTTSHTVFLGIHEELAKDSHTPIPKSANALSPSYKIMQKLLSHDTTLYTLHHPQITSNT